MHYYTEQKFISMASLLLRLRALPIPTLAPDISSNLSFSQSETLSLPKPISPNSVSLSVTSPTLPLISNCVYHKPFKNILHNIHMYMCSFMFLFYKNFGLKFLCFALVFSSLWQRWQKDRQRQAICSLLWKCEFLKFIIIFSLFKSWMFLFFVWLLRKPRKS